MAQNIPDPPNRARRAAWTAVAVAVLAVGAFQTRRSDLASERAQGIEEAEAAAAAARRAQALWSPQRGYASLAGRTFQGATPWGAKTLFEAIPDGSGLAAEFAHASAEQCRGLVEAARTFFDQVIIDGKPQLGSHAEGTACGMFAQNEVRLVKLDPRAGAAGDPSGATIPMNAQLATPAQIEEARAQAARPVRAAQ